jgi:hypothetical protein
MLQMARARAQHAVDCRFPGEWLTYTGADWFSHDMTTSTLVTIRAIIS